MSKPADRSEHEAPLKLGGSDSRQLLDAGHAIVKNGVVYDIDKRLHEAEEYEACMMAMDKAGVPRTDGGGEEYSLWGRACQMMRDPVCI